MYSLIKMVVVVEQLSMLVLNLGVVLVVLVLLLLKNIHKIER